MRPRDVSTAVTGSRRRGAAVVAAVAFGAMAALPALHAPTVEAAPATHVVRIDGTRFEPATLTVHRGDRITFRNQDPFPHTATASDGAFDSKSIAAGKSWTWTARKAGTFAYICAFHPNMTGTLVVRER